MFAPGGVELAPKRPVILSLYRQVGLAGFVLYVLFGQCPTVGKVDGPRRACEIGTFQPFVEPVAVTLAYWRLQQRLHPCSSSGCAVRRCLAGV